MSVSRSGRARAVFIAPKMCDDANAVAFIARVCFATDACSVLCVVRNGVYKSAQFFWRVGVEDWGSNATGHPDLRVCRKLVSCESCVFVHTKTSQHIGIRGRIVFARYAL